MRKNIFKYAALLGAGTIFGILPGCAEVLLLNVATPFLLSQ